MQAGAPQSKNDRVIKRCRARLCLALAVERSPDHRLSLLRFLASLLPALSLAYPSTASGGAANLSARPKTNNQCSRCCSAQFGGELGSSSSSSSRSRSSTRSRRSSSSSNNSNSSSTRRTQVELAQGGKNGNKFKREVLLLLIGKECRKIVVVCLNACSLFFCFGKADNH